MADLNKNTDSKQINLLLTWFCVIAIAVITFFVFSPSLNNDFTNWDDNAYVTDNPLVVNNAVPLLKIFETPVSANYHPLTVLSLALNYRVGNLNPFGYHLVNIIFHVLNTILVFFFIFLLTRRNLLMAAIVSLFFGIHPMHVESVTWISERKDVLYVFFFLAGLITYLQYSETKKAGWYIFTLVLFLLSCLSKGMAVVFPVILLLIDYLNGEKRDKGLWFEKIPFFFISIVFGVLAFKVQSGQSILALKSTTILEQVMFFSYGAIMYIVKLFVPYKLSAFYPYPTGNIPVIFYLSPFLLLGVIAAIIYFFRKKEKEIVFGLLFYFVSVVLVLQFISVGAALTADRYTYLSYIGLLFVIAYLINKVWSRQSRYGVVFVLKYTTSIFVIIAAVLFSYQTYARTQVWKNSETLWNDVIANYPDASIAYVCRGEYYHANNELDKALSDYNMALQLPPSDISSLKKAYYNRGLLYATIGKNNLALSDYTKAIAVDSRFSKAYFNRAYLYSLYGKNDSAIADYTKAIETDPYYAGSYTNRGLLYLNNGKPNLAIGDFSKAIALDTTFADAYNNRGLFYLRFGKDDSAIADFSKAIALNPAAPAYYYNRGLDYKDIHQYEKAMEDFTSGLQLNPQNADLYYDNIGLCDVYLQKYDEAIIDFSKAIAVNPLAPNYWLERSVAENKAGQPGKAKADELKAKQLQVPHP